MKIKQSLIALLLNTINLILIVILFTLSLLFKNIFNYSLINSTLLIIIIILIRIGFLLYKYFTHYIILYDNYLIVHNGLIIKSKQSYHYSKILQVNIYAYPLLRLTNNTKLCLESNDYIYSNINLLLNISDSKKIKKTIRKYQIANQINHSESSVIGSYKVSTFSLFKYSITHTSLLRGLIFVLAIFAFVFILYQQDAIFFTGQDSINKFMDNIIKIFTIYGVIVILLLIYMVINFTNTCIRYYDFTIKDSEDSLLIAHGFLNRVHYRINKKDINGIIYKQNYGDMFLNNYRIDLLVSGYTALNEDFEDDGSYSDRSILVISMNKKQATLLINNTLSQFSEFKKDNHINKSLAIINIIIVPTIISSIILISASFIFKFYIFFAVGGISIILFIIAIIYILFISNQSITIDDKHLYGSSINLLKATKKILIVKNTKILALQYNRNHLLINSYSNLPSNAHLDLYYVNKEVYHNLINILKR